MNWAIYTRYERFLRPGLLKSIESRLEMAHEAVRFMERLFSIRLLTCSTGNFFSGFYTAEEVDLPSVLEFEDNNSARGALWIDRTLMVQH